MKITMSGKDDVFIFTLVSSFIGYAAIAGGLVFSLSSQSVYGAPIQLDETEFAKKILGMSVQVEDFEGFELGEQVSPMTLINAAYASNSPFIAEQFRFPTKHLINNRPDRMAGRIFDSFAPRTILFGLDINAVFPDDVLRVTVVGTSGVLLVEKTMGSFNDFVGFQDTQGLISVAFLNLGQPAFLGNYGFDNVTTGVVPVPAALPMLAMGFVSIFFVARRKE